MVHSAYFPRLMERLRSHISKLLTISLLSVGFCLYLVQPVQQDRSSEAFSSWLDDMIAKTDNTSLQKKLEILSRSDYEIKELMGKVSSDHEMPHPDANLLLKYTEDVEEGRLYQLLFLKWSQYQTSKGMAKAPATQTLKPATSLQPEKSGVHNNGELLPGGFAIFSRTVGYLDYSLTFLDRSLIPMVNGIAIGAP